MVDTVSRLLLPTSPMATLLPATTLLIPLVLVTSPRGRLRLMPTTALMAMEDSVPTATEVTVPDIALFLPLAPLLLLELMLPPPTPGLTLLELFTLPRGLLILSTATATDMDTDTDTPAPLPPEFPLSLTPDSPSRAMLRATAMAMAMVTNHHICSGLTRL